MRDATNKQIVCISETDAETFQTKANAILAGIRDPEIIIDRTKPFTAYIVYEVYKDIPETVLELLELTDPAGGHGQCGDCRHLRRSTDGRVRWHDCEKNHRKVKTDSRACETYYIEKREKYRDALADYQNTPHRIR